MATYFCRVSPQARDVVNYLEREAAEGSEAVEPTNRPTSATPTAAVTFSNLDQQNHGRFSRSISRSEDSYKLSSPVPLEQLLLRQDSDYFQAGKHHTYLFAIEKTHFFLAWVVPKNKQK